MIRTPSLFAFAATLCTVVAPTWAIADEAYPEQAQDAIVVETVLRLEGFNLDSSTKAKAAILRYLEHNVGSDQFFELLRRFPLPQARPWLFDLAIAQPTETPGVEAARLLFTQAPEALIGVARTAEAQRAENLLIALGLAGEAGVVELLLPLSTDVQLATNVRIAAVRAIGRQLHGQRELLGLVTSGEIPSELHFTVANVLYASTDESIRDRAFQLLPPPSSANSTPLPPLEKLVEMRGDATRGAEVFRTVGTCANCHAVAGAGKEVGPDLTEIGSKLSREALLISILDPSAGISHNYETYEAVLDTGTIVSGIKLSETAESVTLKTAEAILRTIPREQIDELGKAKLSLMPADLQRAMSAEQLVDVVEYLLTLRASDASEAGRRVEAPAPSAP
jgi:putative heme-binding domain-containing protein